MPHQDPVFDPQKCPVPVVQAIPQRQIIQNCEVPGPPDPILDCPDTDVPIPPPFTPGAGCPQFQTEVTAEGASFTVQAQCIDDPADPGGSGKIHIFTYDLVVEQGPCCAVAEAECLPSNRNLAVFLDVVKNPTDPQCQTQFQFQFQFPAPSIAATALIDCQTGCNVFLDVKEIRKSIPSGGFQCPQYQFQFQFQVPQGQRGPQGPQGPAGSKMAIVPIREGSPNETYLGLFCTEMPEAVFMDVVDLRLQAYQTTVQMDPRFEQVCEPNSFKVIGVVTPDPILVGARIVDSMVVVKSQAYEQCDEATVLIKGVRKEFADRRFPVFSKEQKEQNDKFWGSSFES